MGVGSCWRRAWGFHVRGEKRKREVRRNWRNSRDLWEELRPVQHGPRLGTGQQSAVVTSHCAPHLHCMKTIFDKSSYPWGKKKEHFPFSTTNSFRGFFYPSETASIYGFFLMLLLVLAKMGT